MLSMFSMHLLLTIAYNNVSNFEGIGKVGQPWMPKANKKYGYLRYLEDIYDMERKTANE